MIRKLSSDDVECHKKELFNLMQIDFKSTYGVEAAPQLVESKIDALPNHILNGRAIVYGLLDGDILSSFIWAYPVSTPTGEVMHIAYIAVGEKDRNKGIGSRLINAVEQDAASCGLNTIELIVSMNNTVARSFYKKNQFEEERLVLKKMVKAIEK